MKKKELIRELPTAKFQIGQTVWKLQGNKVEEVVVYGVVITTDRYEEDQLYFKYYLHLSDGVDKYFWDDESYLFNTKEELIASL